MSFLDVLLAYALCVYKYKITKNTIGHYNYQAGRKLLNTVPKCEDENHFISGGTHIYLALQDRASSLGMQQNSESGLTNQLTKLLTDIVLSTTGSCH